MTIRRMRIACWKTKATNTHSEYVILIVFPLQQWLHERASMLRYTYSLSVLFSIGDARLRLCGTVDANVPLARLPNTRILRLVNERNKGKKTIVPGKNLYQCHLFH